MKPVEELLARQDEIVQRLQQLDAETGVAVMDTGTQREWDKLNEEHRRNVDEIKSGRERRAILGRIAGTTTSEAGFAEAGFQRDLFDTAGDFTAGLRTIEVLERRGALPARSADRLDKAVRSSGSAARYISAAGDEAYLAAFTRLIADPLAFRSMPEAESAALRRVQASVAERAMSVGVEGTIAVPISLDPTVLGVSDGAVNPLRQIARVELLAGETWKGVASEGVTVSYSAEGSEATDDSPTLTQPTCSMVRAQAFIPYSVELGQDWAGLRSELGRLLQEGRDELEATAFTTGAGGTVAPQGVLTGGTVTVTTGGSAVVAVGDVYKLGEALPPRYRPRARYMGSDVIFDKVRQLTGPGSDEMPVWNDIGPTILRKPAHENSAMATTVTHDDLILTVGDFSRYLVIDRLPGMLISVIPHLFGTAHRPTGQSGLWSFWRSGAVVLDVNAFRTLKVL